MPLVLIENYILFIVIPNQFNFWYDSLEVKMHQDVLVGLTVWYKLSYLSDAITYIFIQKEIVRYARNVVFPR